jgi:hypothetical protein
MVAIGNHVNLMNQYLSKRMSQQSCLIKGKQGWSEIVKLVQTIGDDYVSQEWEKYRKGEYPESIVHLENIERRTYELASQGN